MRLLDGRQVAAARTGLATAVLAVACSSPSAPAVTGGRDAAVRDAPLDVSTGDEDSSVDDATDTVIPDALPIFVDPFNGAVGCDAAFRGAFDCAGETLLHGGLDQVFYPDSCTGTVGSPTLRFAGPVRGGLSLELVLTFASGLVAGKAGAQPPASVAITSTGGDAGQQSWATPVGACSVTLDSNVCLPGIKSDNYGISGTGACSQPAAPADGNPAPAIDIPGFSFSADLAAGP